jgi:hypothetical protein
MLRVAMNSTLLKRGVASAVRQKNSTIKRSFHLDTQQHTPMEEMMLDATAWFVGIAICFAPKHEFDDLEYQGYQDLFDDAKKHKRDSENNDDDKKRKP